ncbi:MAG: LysR family transcriptional regulator [Byssovorax sp.]
MAPLAPLPDAVTLDQLRVFLLVAEQGSFSAAARSLRRAQSAVSYAIANLERVLGVLLFEREGRVPSLTEAGRSLLSETRAIQGQVEQLTARARSMAEGVEPRLALAVDVMFPMSALVEAVGAFREAFPAVSLVLHVEALGGIAQLVLDGTCRIGVSSELPKFPAGITRRPLTQVAMISVTGATHPLAKFKGPIPTKTMQAHVQLVLSDRSRLTEGIDLGVLEGPTWRLADLGAKHEFLRAGFGWGGMPLHLVAEDLEAGRLVWISPAEWGTTPRDVPLFGIHRADELPGPAGRWLLDRLEHAAGRADSELDRLKHKCSSRKGAHKKA